MKKPLGRLAGAVLAGVALTLASAPAAFAQDDPTTPVETTATSESTDSPAPTTSDSGTSETPTSDSSTPTSITPPSTTGDIETPADPEVQTTEGRAPAAAKPRTAEDAKDSEDDQNSDENTESTAPADPYTDNAGHGFVGLGGEGVLVIACASGAPGNVATAGLTVTAGPDQDGADGRYWNYDVRVVDGFNGTTTPFSWTCDGQEGHGDVTFEQVTPPTSDTSEPPATSETPSSTGSNPSTSASTSDTTKAAPGPVVTRPAVQVRYAPQGGVETGFGGTAVLVLSR
ncbi:hypothetical protein QRX50_28280 [Amycolatopsis carbonis]|uniref:Secreted protein n=1 Tax=Amycolatopsis carbonis TaxID=715471 RepID=A0A9Y2MS02_9PSEU|nr:hypothetical protein [Amycolatopsis sp. 2-15]WIX75413.1 hypothetical protein QRX50_28280 [Amycolatopsis sp. 2-15]